MRAGRPPARGPHFFLDPADTLGSERAVLRGADAHHLARVLRSRPGDPLSLADGDGTVWQARVATVGAEVEVRLERRWCVPVPRPRLTVVHALPKGRKLDEVVTRLSEVGVDRLVPVCSRRSDVRLTPERAERAVRRWRAVALAAAKQARRARPLEVAGIAAWDCAFGPGGPCAGASGVVLWEDAGAGLASALAAGTLAGTPDCVLVIGPEGGLEAAEVDVTGLPAVSLGPTVLRTETAALVAATLVLDRLGRLGHHHG